MKRKIIFVGSFVSFSDSKSSSLFSQAGNLYQTKLIDILKPQLIISILPIFFRSRKNFSFPHNVCFINNQSIFKNKINNFYRLTFDTLEALGPIRKNDSSIVFFYNLDYQNFLLVVLVKFLLKKKVYVIVADYNHYDKSLTSKVFNSTFKKLDGVIILNSNIRCNNNSILLPGLIYKSEILITNSSHLNKNVILSGSLGYTTGLDLALDFFSKNTDYHLFISGKPFRLEEEEFMSIISHYTSNYRNIHFLGLMEYENYLQVLGNCDIALSLRNPNDAEHNYNFPSKILEYLSKSKMVISTKHYKDLPPETIFYCEYNCLSLLECFKKIYSMTSEQVLERKKSVFNYLNENYTEESVLRLVNQLVRTQDV